MRRGFTPWADPGGQPLVRFVDIAKRFNDVVALDRVNLEIYRGEFFALLGPSGCGKTTLLRILAGFETPAGGAVMLDGRDLAATPPYRRPVNMMFQNYALFPHLSVARNVAFGLRQDGLGRAAIAARVEEMLSLVKLDGLGGRRPDQLSGGQRQRVALARALAKNPDVLLLDEPMAALDRKLREQTQFELMELQARLGTTFIIVTHDQAEAMTLADRIAVMDRGRIVQVATPAEVYERPQSRWVAQFIGDINLIEGGVVSVDGNEAMIEDAAGRRWRVGYDAVPTEALARGMRVAIAVRPEKVRISAVRPASDVENTVRGRVWDVGYLGGVSTYKVRLADGTTMAATVANVSRRTETAIAPDQEVMLSWPPGAALVLTR